MILLHWQSNQWLKSLPTKKSKIIYLVQHIICNYSMSFVLILQMFILEIMCHFYGKTRLLENPAMIMTSQSHPKIWTEIRWDVHPQLPNLTQLVVLLMCSSSNREKQRDFQRSEELHQWVIPHLSHRSPAPIWRRLPT